MANMNRAGTKVSLVTSSRLISHSNVLLAILFADNHYRKFSRRFMNAVIVDHRRKHRNGSFDQTLMLMKILLDEMVGTHGAALTHQHSLRT